MEVWADSSERTDVQTRRFVRVPFQAPVRLTRMTTGQELELQAVNLSENGLYLETVIPFALGEVFRLAFPTSPNGFEQVAAARVVWRRGFATTRVAGQPPGIALAFLMMRPSDRQALTQLVEDGGIIPPRTHQTVPSRAPVATRIVPEEPERETVTRPTFRLQHAGGPDTLEMMDAGPFGWLLVLALALAGIASLLVGMQPG